MGVEGDSSAPRIDEIAFTANDGALGPTSFYGADQSLDGVWLSQVVTREEKDELTLSDLDGPVQGLRYTFILLVDIDISLKSSFENCLKASNDSVRAVCRTIVHEY